MLPLLEIPITVGREAAQREAQEELAKSKYHNELPQPLIDLYREWTRLIERLAHLFFGRRPGDISASNAWGAIGLVAVVLIAIAAFLVWRYGLPRRSGRVRDAAVGTDEHLQPEDYRTLAEQAAAAGDWRTAVQESFRALVRELELRTVLERRPARTAFETAALIAQTWPDLGTQLHAAAVTFNEVIYGHRAATAGDYAVMQHTEQLVLERADAGYVETS